MKNPSIIPSDISPEDLPWDIKDEPDPFHGFYDEMDIKNEEENKNGKSK